MITFGVGTSVALALLTLFPVTEIEDVSVDLPPLFRGGLPGMEKDLKEEEEEV